MQPRNASQECPTQAYYAQREPVEYSLREGWVWFALDMYKKSCSLFLVPSRRVANANAIFVEYGLKIIKLSGALRLIRKHKSCSCSCCLR